MILQESRVEDLGAFLIGPCNQSTSMRADRSNTLTMLMLVALRRKVVAAYKTHMQ